MHYVYVGAVLSAKARLDQELFEVRHRLRHIITALHKAQDKIDLLEVLVAIETKLMCNPHALCCMYATQYMYKVCLYTVFEIA